MALKDILKKIEDEANKKAAFIKQVADDEIKKVHEEAKVKAEERKKEIEVKIVTQSAAVMKKSKTLATMEGRSQALKEKRNLIDQAYVEVEKEMNSLDNHEYLKLITEMMKYVAKATPKGSLTVPSDRKKLTEEAIEKAKVDFHVKSETNEFQGGFIVASGKVEINLSFPYLIQKIVRPTTELDIAKILFP
ncbi:V-type ATP synthase subunit E [candidate division KSB1 bacterium]